MQRWVEQQVLQLRRKLAARYIKLIITFVGAFLLINVICYFLAQLIVSLTLATTTTTEATTILTTTTTTTTEPTTEKPFELGCFFDTTNITLADGSQRRLSSLQIGDEVLVYLSTGQIVKSPVLTIFQHQRSIVRFLEIYTEDTKEPLRLTPSHSIFVKKIDQKYSHFQYSFAYNIVVGDLLLSSDFQPLRITNIKEVILHDQMISTPLTFEGNIIVNNLIASCYATYGHDFMHALTLPLRYWHQVKALPQLNYFIVHFIDFYSTMGF